MKRRSLRILMLPLLGVICLSWIFFRTAHQEQLNDTLITSIKANDLDKARAALRAGADGNARDTASGNPLSPVERLKKLLFPHAKTPSDQRQPALLLYLERQQPIISLSGHTRGRGRDGPAFVKALLDAGADMNEIDIGSNWTPVRLPLAPTCLKRCAS